MKHFLAGAVLAAWAVCGGVACAQAGVLPAPSGSEGAWSDFASREGDEIAFGDALAAITDKGSQDLLGHGIDRAELREKIRQLAWKVRSGIVEGGPQETAEAFRHAFFVVEGLVPDPEFGAKMEAETAILSTVLETKRGVCLSLSLLYLAVADEAGIPLHGVSVPGHFFIRYDQGGNPLNIETLDRGGATRKDSFYRKQFFVRRGEPFYLESLTPKMSLASYLSQLGALYLRRGMKEQAIELLEVARAASPRDPEISTNLGVALRAADRTDKALTAWRTSVVLDPYDDVAHYHLAVELADRSQWLEAIYHFDEALRLGHPVDMAMMRRLEPNRPDSLSAYAPAGLVRTPALSATTTAASASAAPLVPAANVQ